MSIPISLIDTRDCFVFDLIVDEEILNMGPSREKIIKRTFYFDPDCIPSNYDPYLDYKAIKKDKSLLKNYRTFPAGCTTYENFFSHEEMVEMERNIEETEELCSRSKKIVGKLF